jgi:GWxTD domain-containing protein
VQPGTSSFPLQEDRNSNMLRNILVVLVLVCSLHLSAATKNPKLPAQYKKWIDQDVVYIITDEERKAFLTLTTDDEREKYINSFWAIRNPRHGSDNNPYKEEHYARLEYANVHFGRESNTPGWMTDMGRAYILFGAPTSRHPFIGYGQIYPLELWFYQNSTNAPSLPAFFYLLFYISGDIGEYKFYHPFLDGPMKLVRGSQFNSNADVYKFLKPLGGDVAHASMSLVPSEPVDTVNYRPDMSSDMLLAKIENFANDPFNVRKLREMRSLHEKVSSIFLVNQEKPIEISSLVLADPTGKSWLDYGVLIDDPKLGQRDGSQLKVSIGYRLTTATDETVMEDFEERAYAAFDDTPSGEKKFAPFVVASRLPIEPGAYKLLIEVTNRSAHQTYKGEVGVSTGPVKQASFSGPLVTTSVDRVARPNPFQPFQYFGVQFHPAARHEINHPDPLRLLFELHEPADSTANYQMEYVVAHLQDKDARRSIIEDVPHSEFKDGRLLKSKTIAVNDLENGDYRLIVNLRQAGSNEVMASANMPLRISADKTDLPLFFLSDTQALGRPGVAAYMRALEAVSQKNESAAADYFRQALDQNPANTFAGQYLVQLYFSERKYTPIADLYKKLGIAAFKASPVTLAQIALSFRQGGDTEQARSVISTGLGLFPGNSTLTALQTRVQ